MGGDNTTKLKILIEARNKTDRAFARLGKDLKRIENSGKRASKMVSGGFDKMAVRAKMLNDKMKPLKSTFEGMRNWGAIGFGGMTYGMKKAIDASNEMESAMIGLSTVATAFGQDAEKSKQAAVDLAQDGLMSIKDAGEGLKNLLGSGLSLPEAIKLMKGFKDSAAFNRQGTLAFGEAIVGATQGIKNQNSILVDNAGITKNLSMIMKEGGFTMQDLSDKTKGASARAFMFNGLLKEMATFQGDAAKSAETLKGKQAKLGTAFFNMSSAIGDTLAPALETLVDAITPMINSMSKWIEKHPQLTKYILIGTTAIFGLITVLGLVGLAMIALSPIITAIIAGFGLMGGMIGALFSPIGLIIGAIALWIIKWDEIKGGMIEASRIMHEFADYLMQKFSQAIDWVIERGKAWGEWFSQIGTQISSFFQPVIDALKVAVDWLGDAFSAVGRVLKVILGVAIDYIGNKFNILKKIGESVKVMFSALGSYLSNAFTGILDAVVSKIKAMIDWLKDAWSWIKKIITGGDSVDDKVRSAKSSKKSSRKTERYANGGMVNAPRGQAVPAILHGGEMVVPSRDVGKTTGNIVININNGIFSDEQSAREITTQMVEDLKMQVRF